MKTNQAGINLIKRWEGVRLNAYQDSVGVWTIGYGHTSLAGPPEVHSGMTITAEQAGEILVADLAKFEKAVSDVLTRTPTDNQFSAMVSLCFNIGPGNFAKSSVVKRFNQSRIPQAAEAFLLWDKAGGGHMAGLLARRRAERALFLAHEQTDA